MPTLELLTDVQRTALLWELFDALLQHLHRVLSSDEPVKASLLNVARLFLEANGVTRVTGRAGLRQGLQSLGELRALPFDPPPDTTT